MKSKHAAYFRKYNNGDLIAVFPNRENCDGMIEAVMVENESNARYTCDADLEFVLCNSVEATNFEDIGRIAIACADNGYTFLISKP